MCDISNLITTSLYILSYSSKTLPWCYRWLYKWTLVSQSPWTICTNISAYSDYWCLLHILNHIWNNKPTDPLPVRPIISVLGTFGLCLFSKLSGCMNLSNISTLSMTLCAWSAFQIEYWIFFLLILSAFWPSCTKYMYARVGITWLLCFKWIIFEVLVSFTVHIYPVHQLNKWGKTLVDQKMLLR